MCKVARIVNSDNHEKSLTRRALLGLRQINGVEIFGIKDPVSSKFHNRGSIIAFSLKNVPHNLAAKEIAEYGGIGIRNCCFCVHMLIQQILKIQSIKIYGARILSEIIPEKIKMLLPGLLRVSFGIENDENDVDCFIKIIKRIAKKPRSIFNKLLAHTYNGTLFIPETTTQVIIKRFVESSIKKVFSIDKNVCN